MNRKTDARQQGRASRFREGRAPARLSLLSANPPCPDCSGRTYRWGRRRGKQQLKCLGCGKQFCVAIYAPGRAIGDRAYISCVACRGPMFKHSHQRGQQFFRCRNCKVFCRDGKQHQPQPPAPEIRHERQQHAARLAAGLLDAIKAILPSSLPAEFREDVRQETALAILLGEYDLSGLTNAVSECRHRVNRLRTNRFKFVSLSAPIPGTDGLTYADTLAG